MDVIFREDDCRVLKGNAPENLNILRKIALGILTATPDKDSLKVRRKNAGWNDAFAYKLVQNFLGKP